MQDYENDRWRIVAAKVGSGFSPAACREKAAELDAEATGEAEGEGLHETEPGEGEPEEGRDPEEGVGASAYASHHESGMMPEGPGDPHTAFQ
jgi:hypothetical protein